MSSKNILLIAGEKSGEDHALDFIPQIIKSDPSVKFFGVGGDQLAKLGMELLYHLKDFSSWGYSEVLAKIPFYRKALRRMEAEVEKRNCQVAILVDFQGFNLKLARILNKKGVKILYYVAPQAWVWKAHRAQILEKNVHTLFSILPFEKEWFGNRGCKRIVSVTHPLLKSLEKYIETKRERNLADIKNEMRILLLPGSRNSEVGFLLPEFYKAIDLLKNDFSVRVSLVISPNVNRGLYSDSENYVDKIYLSEDLGEALAEADFALAASGTVTLACGLMSVPTVVSYKLSLFNEFLYNLIISYKGPYSLTNIILKKMTFPELLQERASGFNMAGEIKKWLDGGEYFHATKDQLLEVRNLLNFKDSDPAEHMLKVIQND